MASRASQTEINRAKRSAQRIADVEKLKNARKAAKKLADANASLAQNLVESQNIRDQINALTDEIYPKEETRNKLYKEYMVDSLISVPEAQMLKSIDDAIASAIAKRKKLQVNLNEVNKKKLKYESVIRNAKNVDTPTDSGVNTEGGYKYNAPMVKSAYLTSNKGTSTENISYGKVGPGNYTDARHAWENIKGEDNNNYLGRGVIQMDRDFANRKASGQGESSKDNRDRDTQMYGFKFLYNPSEVEMGWQIQQAMNPTFLAEGKDAFQIISADLLGSTISFTLLINRIEDFKVRDPTTAYPSPVSKLEREKILERGTMYDLEYLFKTLNGPSANFLSPLNGITADRGWLRPAIVELHLGKRLRYRVRLATFGVKHSIFTPNMIPMLTSVSLQFARFNDAAMTQQSRGEGFSQA